MQVSHLKQGFRINRSIGVAFLAYETAAGFFIHAEPGIKLHQILLGLGFVAALAFLLLNELSYRSIKRQQNDLNPMLVEKCTILLPLGVSAFVALSYLLTGQLGILLFSTVAAFQAQLVGHKRLGRWTLGTMLVLFLATIPLGYPQRLGYTGLSGPWVTLALLTPFMLTLLQIGSVIADIVRSTQYQVTRLKSLAATDGLTGLINRRQFNQQLQAEIARAARSRRPLSLALFDIDDFKKLNDFYGHQVGDRVLRELGELLRHNVRESDVPARYGGEEFALILPETRLAEAYDILERLRAVVEHTVFCLPDNPITLTLSVGVAQFDREHGSSFELIEQADAALYEAKKQGKNRVVYGVIPTPKLNLQQLQPPR